MLLASPAAKVINELAETGEINANAINSTIPAYAEDNFTQRP
jgi:hypothetical protein